MTQFAEYGPWHDPHSMAGMENYRQTGYTVHTPDQTRQLPYEEILDTAQMCGRVLQITYRGYYPLDTGDAERLTGSVLCGDTDLRTLSYEGTVFAMSALVYHNNPLGGTVRRAELGRAASVPAPDGRRVPLSPFLKDRIRESREEGIRPVDYYYSSTRAVGQPYMTPAGEMPDSRGVQGTWWGSRCDPRARNALLTTHGSWDYRLYHPRPEPFNGFVIPSDPHRFARDAPKTPVFVDSAESAHIINTLLVEGSQGAVRPTVVAAPTAASKHQPFGLGLVEPHTSATAGHYVVTEADGLFDVDDLDGADKALGGEHGAFSQTVVIEADVASTPRGAHVMRKLRDRGFTLVGWEPSDLYPHAICPALARISPEAAPHALEPHQRPKYFDKLGLPQTAAIVTAGYTAMRTQAMSAK